MLNSTKHRKNSAEKNKRESIERFDKHEKKLDKEFKFLLNRVKIENINEAVQEVMNNAIGKEETKNELVDNQESILHNEILKHNLNRIDSAKLLKNKKKSLNMNNKNLNTNKNNSCSNNNLNKNNNIQKVSSVGIMTKNTFNVHKNFNYVFNKYNKNKFLNKIYNPPNLLKKKSEAKTTEDNKNNNYNQSDHKYYFSNKHATTEGCKFRFFNKKYSSSSEKKNDKMKFDTNSNNQRSETEMNKINENKNKIINPLIRSVPLSSCKTEETFFKRNYPEYLKIKPNSSHSSNNFSKSRSPDKLETNSNRKLPIHNRLYEIHAELKNKHMRLVREMTPSFTPKLYKPLKRITFENYFI
jgi:hypothetical protein